MKQLVFPTCLFFLYLMMACSNSKEMETKQPQEVETIPAYPKAILVTNFSTFQDSAPVQITSVELVKYVMKINVKYSGGCQKHTFQLIGSKLISKALPPQRSIQLYHDNEGDDCREIVEEELIFDISAFGYQKQETSLVLKGYDKIIPYIPSK